MCDKLKKYTVVKLPNLDFLKNMKGANKFLTSDEPGNSSCSPLRPPSLLKSSLLHCDSPSCSRSPLPSPSLLKSRSPLRFPSPLRSSSSSKSRSPLRSGSSSKSRSPLRSGSTSKSHSPLRSGSTSKSHSPLRSGSHSPLRSMGNMQYTDTIAFRKFVAKSLILVLKRTENLDARLKHIESELAIRKNVLENESEDETITLPLQSVEELQEFEASLHDKGTFKKMLKRFKFCEGKTVSTVTNAVLKKIMNNVTATEYSWQGRKGKKSLHNLFRLSALIKSKNCHYLIFKVYILYHFCRSRTRKVSIVYRYSDRVCHRLLACAS
ncbi:hypothetical protein ABEB36_015713 [Hypothenemus hampei]|uniref:DUF4806 domain-containing protein n=1 Tax=Hypothenemus hampei TaxID=57062 RepID=A0ABD1E1K3_HYPHA